MKTLLLGAVFSQDGKYRWPFVGEDSVGQPYRLHHLGDSEVSIQWLTRSPLCANHRTQEALWKQDPRSLYVFTGEQKPLPSDCDCFLWPVSFLYPKTLGISKPNLASREPFMSLFCVETLLCAKQVMPWQKYSQLAHLTLTHTGLCLNGIWWDTSCLHLRVESSEPCLVITGSQ